MAERAQVGSIDALDAFRASLVVYMSKARPLLDEVSSDLRRTQLWMETDRRLHWEREVARGRRSLEEAQQALLSARIATFREVTAIEQNAVHAARRRLEDAEEKLALVRRWIRDLGPRTESLARQVTALDSVLFQDLPRAVAWLTEAVRHLEAYGEIRRALSPSSPDPAAPADEAATPAPAGKDGANAA